MQVFQPQIQVTLVKTQRRESLGNATAAGQAAVLPDLTRLGQFTELDLTPFLIDGGGLRTSRSVRDPAGTFSMSLNDRPSRGDSLYGLIEPMDLIEIRFARLAVDRARRLPLVMRGLVTAVNRSESMEGDTPSRAVHVSGHDFGKILQMLRIYYLPGSVVGEAWLDEFKFFRQYNLDAKPKPAAEFLSGVVERVINPYVQAILAIVQGRGLTVSVPRAFTPECTAVGIVSPIGVSQFNGGSVYELLQRFIDVGPFNELFVEDRGDSVALVCRPCPWRDLSGAFIDSTASAEKVAVADADVMMLNVGRSDGGVANYFWCGNGAWELVNNGTLQLLAQSGTPGSYTAFDYVNSRASLYGVCKMEVESRMGDPLGLDGFGPPAPDARRDRDGRTRWLDNRRTFLALSNRDNVVLESGQLRLRGNEKVRAGMYIDLQRGAVTSTMYAVVVTHEFVPAVGFFTTVDFERGTGFVERQQRVGNPWLDERDEAGAI